MSSKKKTFWFNHGLIKAGVQQQDTTRPDCQLSLIASRRVMSLDDNESANWRQSGSVGLSLNTSVGSYRVASLDITNGAASADCDLVMEIRTNQKPVGI